MKGKKGEVLVIKVYPTHKGKEYPMDMEFYEDGTVKLVVPEGTPKHLVQEASGYILEGMSTMAEKMEKS